MRSCLSWRCFKSQMWSSFFCSRLSKHTFEFSKRLYHFFKEKWFFQKLSSSHLWKEIFTFSAWKKTMFQNYWSSSKMPNWTRVTRLKPLCSVVYLHHVWLECSFPSKPHIVPANSLKISIVLLKQRVAKSVHPGLHFDWFVKCGILADLLIRMSFLAIPIRLCAFPINPIHGPDLQNEKFTYLNFFR